MRQFDYISYRDRPWSDEILGLVAQIHEHKRRTESFLNNKHHILDKLAMTTAIKNTEASNKIGGIVTTEARLQKLCDRKAIPHNEDECELLNYYRVVRYISDHYIKLTVSAETILHLHRMLFVHSKKSGGKYKNQQNFITDPIDEGVRFMPLIPYETSEAVEKLCIAYNDASAVSAVDSLLIIPVFVNDFLCIHPFNTGNGRMSRLMTFLLLLKSGYLSVKYLATDCSLERSQAKYYKALSKSDNDWHVSKNDPEPFIKYTLNLLCESYEELESSTYFLDEKLLSIERVNRAVVTTKGKFTKNDIIRLVPSVGKASIENALKQLTDTGIIERFGKGRATFYTRAEKKITPRF